MLCDFVILSIELMEEMNKAHPLKKKAEEAEYEYESRLETLRVQ